MMAFLGTDPICSIALIPDGAHCNFYSLPGSYDSVEHPPAVQIVPIEA